MIPPWKPSVVYPYYLAYFNELAGGPRRGHERFVDSNLDWGQELKGLKRWLDAHRVTEPINLCYFGTADPRYYQIAHFNTPGSYRLEPQERGVRVPGLLAISATQLEGAYYTAKYRAALAQVLAGARLVDVVGYSIFIYRLDGPAQQRPLVR